MQPEFEDETPINPFDFWEGANFKLKIRKVDGYWNYDKSEFDSVSALLDDDGELDNIGKNSILSLISMHHQISSLMKNSRKDLMMFFLVRLLQVQYL